MMAMYRIFLQADVQFSVLQRFFLVFNSAVKQA